MAIVFVSPAHLIPCAKHLTFGIAFRFASFTGLLLYFSPTDYTTDNTTIGLYQLPTSDDNQTHS